MRKRWIILIILVILIGATFIFVNQANQTTYGNEISTLVNEDDIQEIEIEDIRNNKQFRTNDQQVIHDIITKPSDMQLQKVNNPPKFDYTIGIKTSNSETYFIMLGENRLQIAGGYHHEVDQVNELYDIIQSSSYDWEPLE
ncbi:hypothetical protein [Aquisalibacillus elongatus]|uniref:Uncharacterized protein n=1 Tax=Aquisalibacillus elongatus TaxID=485577 RepID=A0A3N5BPT0_9BACI|nr:hypothetical protein [Aquisalibacillus elongatus]RPF57070.1 hypothetical protein EDC24_0021 [Aquisalibacillus elongatus]